MREHVTIYEIGGSTQKLPYRQVACRLKEDGGMTRSQIVHMPRMWWPIRRRVAGFFCREHSELTGLCTI